LIYSAGSKSNIFSPEVSPWAYYDFICCSYEIIKGGEARMNFLISLFDDPFTAGMIGMFVFGGLFAFIGWTMISSRKRS